MEKMSQRNYINMCENNMFARCHICLLQATGNPAPLLGDTGWKLYILNRAENLTLDRSYEMARAEVWGAR